MRRRSKRPTVPKKSPEEKLVVARDHFKLPKDTLSEGDYALGFDPGKRNLGWAVFQIRDKKAQYVGTGTLKVKGASKPQTANKQIQFDNESILHLNEFLSDLMKKYKPKVICWEDTMGGGISTARTLLGEVQGLIKLTAYMENDSTVMLAGQTRCMETLLLGTSLKRGLKKIATGEKIKSLFPKKLEDRKVTKTGQFTHEADAIGCLYALFRANDINIEGVSYEKDSTDGD